MHIYIYSKSLKGNLSVLGTTLIPALLFFVVFVVVVVKSGQVVTTATATTTKNYIPSPGVGVASVSRYLLVFYKLFL